MNNLSIKIVNDVKEFDTFIDLLSNQQEFCFDFESSGLETHSLDIKIVGLGVGWSPNSCYYIPFNGNIPPQYILDKIQPIMENDTIRKIGHNLKFDCRLFDRFGVKVKGLYFDTIVASYCLHGDTCRHNLDDLVLMYLNHIKIRTKSLIPKKSKSNPKPSMLDSPINLVGTYCSEDVIFSYRLYKIFYELLNLPENKVIHDIFYTIDMPLVSTLLKMECNGVKIDIKRLEELRVEIQGKLVTLQTEINTLAKKEVSLTKATDIAQAVYDDLDVENKYDVDIPLTKSKKRSTSKSTLEMFKDEAIVAKILEYKQLIKLMSTYVIGLKEMISGHTDLLHPFFGQVATSTARLNSSNPNCYDNQTEILTENGWKLFKDLNNEKVAQYLPTTNKIMFVNYSNYIEKESEIIYNIESEIGHINLAVTEDHRILLKTRKDRFFDATPLTYSSDKKIISAGILNNELKEGINYDLIFAIQADGSLTKTGVDFSFRKQRKIDRFEKSIAPLKQYKDRKRIVLPYASIPNYVWEYIDKTTKKFTSKLIELACPQVIDYLMAWDGVNERQDMWLSKHKSDIDIVQALLTCSGYRSILGEYSVRGVTYPLLRVTHKNYTFTTNSRVSKKCYNNKVYCVSVPSSYIVVRRGRAVCISGNCQNIPARTTIGKKLREVFISRYPGGKILAVDYSQAELRILAHLGNEQIFLNAFNNNEDVHLAVAAEVVFKKKREDVTKEERSLTKNVNFSLLYGARAKKLGELLGIPAVEAQNIIDTYMRRMGGLKVFLDNSKVELEKFGYTTNYFNRKRFLPKIYSKEKFDRWAAEREGANNKIQSTNADIIRIAMNRIDDMLSQGNYQSKLILQVHDELVFDLHPDEIDIIPQKVVDIMEAIVQFKLKMKADAKYADNWAAAH